MFFKTLPLSFSFAESTVLRLQVDWKTFFVVIVNGICLLSLNRELKNHDDDFVDDDRKWDTVYCASAASKFRRRGLVDDAKHSSVRSSCFTSFGRYKSSVFRLFFTCSLHFFVFVNPGILFFSPNKRCWLKIRLLNFFSSKNDNSCTRGARASDFVSYKFILFCTYISRKGKSR